MKIELLVEFVLPLLRETARCDDEAARYVPTNNEFLNKETRHNRLACARIISQKEPQGLTVQHGFVHCCDLVGQRINGRCVNGDQRIKKECQAQALRLRSKTE